GITTLKGCILRMEISHPLTTKIVYRKCPMWVGKNGRSREGFWDTLKTA
ncbi:MAG: hypothetical protein ACI8ZV_000599, partial [Chitinophagales bacterium]